MKLKLSLKSKIIIGLVSITSLLFTIAISIIISTFYKNIYKNLLNNTNIILKISSNYFGTILDRDMEILRTVRDATVSFREKLSREKDFRDIQRDFCEKVLSHTPQFLSISINWQISYLQHNPALYGRIRYTYYRDSGRINTKIDTLETKGDNILGLYYKYKISKEEGMTEPYYYSYTKGFKPILMTSLVTPILQNDKFIGLVDADVALTHFYQLLSQITPNGLTSYNFLISHTQKFIAFTGHKQLENKPITSFFDEQTYTKYIYPNITQQTSFTFIAKDKSGKKYYFSFQPIKIGNFKKAWYVGSMVPMSVIKKPVNKLIVTATIVYVILILLLVIFTIVLANTISNFLKLMETSIKELAEGAISEQLKIPVHSSDELGVIAESINKLIDNLKRLSEFAKQIGQGNLDTEFHTISDKDILGKAFLDMRHSLQIAKLEDLKRKQEEEINNWTVHGENMFAKILREHNQDLQDLAYHVISNLVKYTDSVQGGLFIINEDDPNNKYIELIAAYAYDRRKYLTKKIPFGVGLLGRTAIEGETIYISDVPPDYLSITSGLGDRHPNSLLIVPFKFNEVIYAIVELASFKGYKAYVRRFVERIGVSVASTIANVRITEKTKKLVEELRARSLELAAQEEEMRQNLEEMRATQEELRKKAQELESLVDALNSVSYIIELTPDGYITNINEKFLLLIKRKKEEILGKHLVSSLAINVENDVKLEDLLQKAAQGEIQTFKAKILTTFREYWFDITLVPVQYENQISKIIFIGNDISNYINKNE